MATLWKSYPPSQTRGNRTTTQQLRSHIALRSIKSPLHKEGGNPPVENCSIVGLQESQQQLWTVAKESYVVGQEYPRSSIAEKRESQRTGIVTTILID